MRHRFHAICPYFAMFPETFVQKYLVWTKRGDRVFDPFSGRGTTVFQSLLQGREAAGCDVNAVAFCLSNAKADPPEMRSVLLRMRELQAGFADSQGTNCCLLDDPFFALCFHKHTLSQVMYLRSALNWRKSRVDRFIAALALGVLHGESHRSARYLSNRMPRTISTKRNYSVGWWRREGYLPPKRDVFRVLRQEALYRFESDPAEFRGRVALRDARTAYRSFPRWKGTVNLIITSPPYLDTTNFEEDQWLRLWFLGGSPRPVRSKGSDDRHVSPERYWKFLAESWRGVKPLLARNAQVVIRIGGKTLDIECVTENLGTSLSVGFGRTCELLERSTSSTDNSQTRSFQKGPKTRLVEFDFRFSCGVDVYDPQLESESSTSQELAQTLLEV